MFQLPHDITVDRHHCVYISEIDVKSRKKVLKYEINGTSNEIHHSAEEKKKHSALNTTDSQRGNPNSSPTRNHQKLSLETELYLFFFAFLLTCLIGWLYISFRFNRRQKHDLNVAFRQLFTTPKDSGFNRLALDEELNEHLMIENSDNSDSEVEEFSSKNYTHKLPS